MFVGGWLRARMVGFIRIHNRGMCTTYQCHQSSRGTFVLTWVVALIFGFFGPLRNIFRVPRWDGASLRPLISERSDLLLNRGRDSCEKDLAL